MAVSTMPHKDEVESTEDKIPKRETWTNQLDFLLACIGFSVGLGNVWRFPYLCYKNGGGAFLIPYFICVTIGGIPMFFLEVAVGQFMSEGGIRAWRICPILQGIGWATTTVVFFVNCYYNVILAWAFYYLFASFTTRLPWEDCNNYWNTPACTVYHLANSTENDTGITNTAATNQTNTTVLRIDPTTEFWEHKVLNISSGVDDPVGVKWDMCLCLLLAWIVVYLCICKGVKSTGKVVYFTATAPYVFMTILLIRGCTLDGALDGILYYVIPDFERLAHMQVWVDAGTQIFFSYAISLGGLTALGSYNKYNHNSYRDAIVFSLTNSGTSIFAGFLIFSVLGYMAKLQNTSVGLVAESGPGLAFVVYPKAVAAMPIAPLWSALFFFMIILLGLDSQFVGVEALSTAFLDAWPTLRRKYIRESFIGVLCIVQFFVGISMVTNGGMYVFQLFDYYSGSRIVLLIAFFEIVAISYIYGVNRFYDNIEAMFGYRLNPFMKINWVFCSPIYCLGIFIMSTVNYSELDYRRPSGIYNYPQWAVAIGWVLAVISAIWIPVYALYKIVQYARMGKPFRCLLEPEDLKPHQLRPQDKGYMVNVADEPPPPPYDQIVDTSDTRDKNCEIIIMSHRL